MASITIKAALAGFFTIAIGIAILAWIVPDQQIRHPMRFFIFLALAVCAWFCWFHPDSPRTPRGWLSYIGCAVLCGLILVTIDAAIYGLHSGHVILDLSISTLGSIIAVSGLARSLVVGEQSGAKRAD